MEIVRTVPSAEVFSATVIQYAWSESLVSRIYIAYEDVTFERNATLILDAQGKFTLASLLLRDIKNEGCRRVEGRTFIILTDFDKEGVMLYKRLKGIITELGGKLDDFPRKQYISLKFPPLIEELESFTRRRVEDWDYLKIK